MNKEQEIAIKYLEELVEGFYEFPNPQSIFIRDCEIKNLEAILKLIQQLQEENTQKDKIIYLATKFIWESGAGRRGFTCCFAKECNKYGCEICIKQYFQKKASEE